MGATAAAVCTTARPDLDAVYQAELAYVWRTLRRLGVAASEVEDLVHDVFLVVHRRLADYDPERPVRPWLFGIALRVASRHRRDPRRRESAVAVDLADPGAAADEQLASHQTRELVLRLLQTLDLKRRAVLIMSDIDGRSAPEIAEVLQIPLNTVYSRLRSARQKFAANTRRVRAVGGDLP